MGKAYVIRSSRSIMSESEYMLFGDLVRKHSAFKSVDELINAKGGYRPSISVGLESIPGANLSERELDKAERIKLADLYDKYMSALGDDRRAFRYGGAK